MGTFKAKSAIISRKPNKDRNKLWHVLIALFEENNPHLNGVEPKRVLEYKEIEEVKVRELETSFFPTGNDVVINNLEKVEVKAGEKGLGIKNKV